MRSPDPVQSGIDTEADKQARIVTPAISNLTTSLNPWYLSWLGGEWTEVRLPWAL